MTTTLAAIDPNSRRRGLLVEVHPELSEPVPSNILRDFCERLWLRHIRVGLLVTPDDTLVVRDRLSSRQFSADEYQVNALKTQTLLDAAQLGDARRDDELGRQFLEYLTAVAASWSRFLPSEAMPVMIPEVVSEIAKADFEAWDGPLEESDAR